MSTIRPWHKVRTDTLLVSRILKIREDIVTDPRDGAEHPRVVIECPEWVNVIPVTPDGKVVLIRQYRFGIAQSTLEVPGGMVDAGETPAEAAARELEEETGYRAEEIRSLGWVHPNPALQDNRSHSFVALGCRKVHDGRQDDGEDIEVELRDRSEIPALIRSQEISHALVVVAFFLEQLTAAPPGR